MYFQLFLEKYHLGKCIQENNWEASFKRYNQRPLDQIIDLSSIKVLAGLEKYGINLIQ